MDQPKIERMLRLMKMMSGNENYTITELSKKLDMSYRTVYRYIDTFKASGFVVNKVRTNVYKIGKMPRSHVDMKNLIYFSEGEFKTAHYSLCTAFMALSMMLPGMVAGYIQEAVGYTNFFIFVMICCLVTVFVTMSVKVDSGYGKKMK